MALRDTIEGARKEAQEAGGFALGSKKGEETVARSTKKKSAASAKPSREAAASVRVAESRPLSKDEQKDAKRKERNTRDIRARATQILIDTNPEYRRTERVWWIILGIGLVLTLIALALYSWVPEVKENPMSPLGIASVVALIAAYACIVISFVYDWRKRRPIRKEMEKKADGLTEKRAIAIITKDNEERAAKKAAKKAAREAKKASE